MFQKNSNNFLKNQTSTLPVTKPFKIVHQGAERDNTLPNNVTQINQLSLTDPVQQTEMTPVQMIQSEGVINTNQTENNVHRNHSNPMFMQQDVPRNTGQGGLNFNNLKSCDFVSKFLIIVCSLL
jgi:hypothetical protein